MHCTAQWATAGEGGRSGLKGGAGLCSERNGSQREKRHNEHVKISPSYSVKTAVCGTNDLLH